MQKLKIKRLCTNIPRKASFSVFLILLTLFEMGGEGIFNRKKLHIFIFIAHLPKYFLIHKNWLFQNYWMFDSCFKDTSALAERVLQASLSGRQLWANYHHFKDGILASMGSFTSRWNVMSGNNWNQIVTPTCFFSLPLHQNSYTGRCSLRIFAEPIQKEKRGEISKPEALVS